MQARGLAVPAPRAARGGGRRRAPGHTGRAPRVPEAARYARRRPAAREQGLHARAHARSRPRRRAGVRRGAAAGGGAAGRARRCHRGAAAALRERRDLQKGAAPFCVDASQCGRTCAAQRTRSPERHHARAGVRPQRRADRAGGDGGARVARPDRGGDVRPAAAARQERRRQEACHAPPRPRRAAARAADTQAVRARVHAGACLGAAAVRI